MFSRRLARCLALSRRHSPAGRLQGESLLYRHYSAGATPPASHTASTAWQRALATALAACAGGSLLLASSSQHQPVLGDSAGTSLLSRETRLRAFYDYERRLRERSGPDKIFEYFASVRGQDGAVFMVPIDFLRASVPVFPPYGSTAARSGRLPGENASGVAAQPTKVPEAALNFFHRVHSARGVAGRDGKQALIDFGEFVLLTTLVAIPHEEAAACFRMFDEDNSGGMDAEEFATMMRVLRNQTRVGQQAGKAYSRIAGDGGTAEALDEAAAHGLFFGSRKNGTLSLRTFQQFLDDLHDAMVALEFAHYDIHGTGAISPADFGLSLVAGAGGRYVDELLKRCASLPGADGAPAVPPPPPPSAKSRKQPPSLPPPPEPHRRAHHGITLEDFRQFHALKDNLGQLRCAVTAYDAANGALTKPRFTAAVHRVCGIRLSQQVVDTLFAVFDVDGDGTLEPSEFLDIMERRARLDAMRSARHRDGPGSVGDALRGLWAALVGAKHE